MLTWQAWLVCFLSLNQKRRIDFAVLINQSRQNLKSEAFYRVSEVAKKISSPRNGKWHSWISRNTDGSFTVGHRMGWMLECPLHSIYKWSNSHWAQDLVWLTLPEEHIKLAHYTECRDVSVLPDGRPPACILYTEQDGMQLMVWNPLECMNSIIS